MFESISEVFKHIYYALAWGLIIYIIYLFFDLMAHVNQQNDYDKYLKKNGIKSYEEKFIEQCKNDPMGIENISVQEEINSCNVFIGKNPNNMYAISRRAFLYSSMKDYNEAIRDYNYLMKKDPKNFDYVENCAMMYAYINDLNTALNLINNFYINKKKDSEYFYTLAKIYEIVKDFNFALKNYNQAINLNPNNEFYYDGRAFVYKQMGDEDKYQRDMKKSKEIHKIQMDKNAKFRSSLRN